MNDLVQKNATTYVSQTPEATSRFGRLLGASVLADRDVLVLTGDLGSGKTQLTKGIAEGLGSSRTVISPTFTLMIAYTDGRIPLFHFDLYRLNTVDDLGDAGVLDALGEEGISVIEWGERFVSSLVHERLDIAIRYDMDSDVNVSDVECGCGHYRSSRELLLTPYGARAHQILIDLSVAFSRNKDGH